MKATIDVPEDLYRRVKAKSAMEGHTIREVTMALYLRWLEEEPIIASNPTPEQWLEEWLKLVDEALEDAPPGPTARALLEEERNRLEPR